MENKHHRKKLLGAGVILLLFVMNLPLTSGMPVSEQVLISEPTSLLINGAKETVVFESTAPLAPKIVTLTINFTAGNPLKIQRIEKLMNTTIYRLILPRMYVFVHGFSFTLTYEKKMPLRQNSVFSFISLFLERGGGGRMAWNTDHTAVVTNFNGVFVFSRMHPLKLSPARIGFIGTCENVTITLLE